MYKISAAYPRVREFLSDDGWEIQGKEEEMDIFRNKKTGRRVFAEDISEGSPVTFLMGGLGLEEFRRMARRLTPRVDLLEVESSWEGEPTTVVVAMSESQARDMFGGRTRMRPVPAGSESDSW